MGKHTKKGSGGKRAGAGAKTKYGERTDTISKRVPASKKSEISDKWDADLEEFKVKSK